MGDDPPSVGGWQGLASALQRHTLHDALIHLDPQERRLVTLAYLQGRTNRQIAALLGIPVSAVGRRLSAALDHLDAYVRRTGSWTAGLLLLGLSYLSARAGRLGHAVASAGWPDRAAASVAAVAVAAVSLGLVVGDAPSSSPPLRATPTKGINLVVTPWDFARHPTAKVVPVVSTATQTLAIAEVVTKTTTTIATTIKPTTKPEADPIATTNRGCHGRPIDVPTTGRDKPEGRVVHLKAGGCSR